MGYCNLIEACDCPQTLPCGWATPVSIGLSLEDIEELLR